MRYYATLGYHPNVLLDLGGFLDAKPTVSVFHGDANPRQQRAIERAKVLLGELGLDAEWIEIQSPWNVRECLAALFQAYENHGRPSEVVVGATGGTEVLNSAATVFAALTHSQARFWDRRTRRAHVISFKQIVSALNLTGRKRDALELLIRHQGTTDLSTLTSHLGVTAGAVTQIVASLNENGLVLLRNKQAARGKVVELTEALWPFGLANARQARRGRG